MADGVMEQIRCLLRAGKTSGQIIALGYAPGTVYKVQRQVRRRGQGGAAVHLAPGEGGRRLPWPSEFDRFLARMREMESKVTELDTEKEFWRWLAGSTSGEDEEARSLKARVQEAEEIAKRVSGQLSWWGWWG